MGRSKLGGSASECVGAWEVGIWKGAGSYRYSNPYRVLLEAIQLIVASSRPTLPSFHEEIVLRIVAAILHDQACIISNSSNHGDFTENIVYLLKRAGLILHDCLKAFVDLSDSAVELVVISFNHIGL